MANLKYHCFFKNIIMLSRLAGGRGGGGVGGSNSSHFVGSHEIFYSFSGTVGKDHDSLTATVYFSLCVLSQSFLALTV